MPVNRRVPLATLRDALLRAVPSGPRVLFEYVLIDHFNDAPADADLVASFVRGLRCRIDVVQINPCPDPALTPPPPERLSAFVQRFPRTASRRSCAALVHRTWNGACGQLRGRSHGIALTLPSSVCFGAQRRSVGH